MLIKQHLQKIIQLIFIWNFISQAENLKIANLCWHCFTLLPPKRIFSSCGNMLKTTLSCKLNILNQTQILILGVGGEWVRVPLVIDRSMKFNILGQVKRFHISEVTKQHGCPKNAKEIKNGTFMLK